MFCGAWFAEGCRNLPIMSTTIVPKSPTIVLQIFQTHRKLFAWAEQVRQIHPRPSFFTDEEANAVPHQAADERFHGVEPDREAQDHRGDPGDAQCWDIKVTRQALETSLSSKDLVLDVNLSEKNIGSDNTARLSEFEMLQKVPQHLFCSCILIWHLMVRRSELRSSPRRSAWGCSIWPSSQTISTGLGSVPR